MRKTLLPFALPEIGDEELSGVQQVLSSGWITMGPKVEAFEKAFAESLSAPYAVAVNSCTAALHLALEAAGVGPGDFVLTSPYTFAATAEVIDYLDAAPVFVDVDPETLNMDPVQLEQTVVDLKQAFRGQPPKTAAVRRVREARPDWFRRKARVRAVIPVHVAGHPAEMHAIESVASAHDLAVIEDAAHALPARYRKRTVGSPPSRSIPWSACFSFYATKTLTTGEGGMIVTDNPQWAERFRTLRLHGITSDAWKRYSDEGHWYYEIIAAGFKYNMTDVAAAIGLAQLEKLEATWKRREKIALIYNEAFSVHPSLQVPLIREGVEHAWHLYMLRLNEEAFLINRAQFLQELKERNIAASVHFIPLHVHPYYRRNFGYRSSDFPVAFREYCREVSLPIYSRMSDQDVQDVILAVLDVVNRYSDEKRYALGRA